MTLATAESADRAELDALAEAFEKGNFARVREGAARLLASCKDEEVKQAAADLLARTKPDPLAAMLVGVTGLILVVLTTWWVIHGHHG